MYVVLMAGGSGTRFWPKSRKKKPKQLLNIFGERTMLQTTVERIQPIVPVENIYVVIGEEIEDEVRKQIPDVPVENILVEPLAKNTAICIGLAAVTIQRRDSQGTMAVLPADHIIVDEKQFRRVLLNAERVAASGPYLVTLGIIPTRPETGYGYIRKGEKLQIIADQEIYRVRQFIEKPDVERAKKFTASGEYFWNSGMFLWSVSTLLVNIRRHMPVLYDGLMEIVESLDSEHEVDTVLKVYQTVDNISIDYGVMEKTEDVVVLPSHFGWSDVGSWASLGHVSQQDDRGNVVQGRFIGLESNESIVVAPEKLIAAIGINNLIVVDTPDALLLCPKDRAQEVKKIVEYLEAEGLIEYL